MVVSSAPSSAYYSDLSVTAMPGGTSGSDRAYEIVGLTVMSQPLPNWEAATAPMAETTAGTNPVAAQRRIPRLAAINETSTSANTVPSDYV